MSDFRNAVFSFPIEVFRVLAPPLRHWSIQQAPLPCWRLWWNTNSGGSVTWKDQRMVLGPDRFVLVAPETRFEVALGQPVRRHLFIHFHLGAEAWRMTDRVFEIPASTETGGLARSLVRRLSPDPDIAIAEPLRGISLVGAVLAEIDPGQWRRAPTDVRVRRVVTAMDTQPGLAWPDETLARLAAMSVGGFVRLFRQSMGGQSPQAYLTAQRLVRARNFLLHTELSIEAIAESSGFCDRSYFSTVFRREVGLPPARYRQEGRTGVVRNE